MGRVLTGLPNNEVVPSLKEKVVSFKETMPTISSLRNPTLQARHWLRIERLVGKATMREKEFTLAELLEMEVTTGPQSQQGSS